MPAPGQPGACRIAGPLASTVAGGPVPGHPVRRIVARLRSTCPPRADANASVTAMETGLASLLAVVVVAAMAPVLRAVLPGPPLAPVVFMLLGGILIGPQALDIAVPSDLALLSDIGLGFLFLLAGYEIEPRLFRQQPGRLALRSWWVSAGLGLIATTVLTLAGAVTAPIAVAIGLTTTALGTLLPILREAELVPGRLGPYVLSAGAVGEILPILAMALLLTSRGFATGLLAIAALGVWALGIVKLIDVGRERGWGERLGLPEHATSQATLRWAIVVLVALLLVAEALSIDIVMGAFLAGMVLRYWSPGDVPQLEAKLDAIGYGFFIPIFFVYSGMVLDLDAIGDSPWLTVSFFVLLFAVRGLPNLWLYRADLDRTQQWQLGLFSATALPLLVALTSIAVADGIMPSGEAAALVAAGVLSVIVFPTIAVALRSAPQPEAAVPGERNSPSPGTGS